VLRDDLDRRIVRLAVPALGTLAVEPLYLLVDTAIVGRLGTSALAGLALAMSVLLLVLAGCNFLSYGTTQRFANARGAGRPDRAAAVGVQALWLSALIGLPLAVLLVVVVEPLARLLGGSGETLDACVTYVRISAIGLPFVLVALVGHGVLRGVADLRRPLVIVVVANVANVILEIVAVYGLDLGIAGSAWSTVCVQIGAAAAFFVALVPHLRSAPTRRPDRTELAPLLTAGRDLLLRVGAMLAAFTGATAVAARVDTATLAAHQIVAGLFGLLALALDALAIPAQTFVAESLGARDRPLASRTGWAATRLSLFSGVGIAVGLAVLAWPLPHLFTSDPAVAARATPALLVLAVMQLPAGIAFGLDGALIGAGDYRFLALASLVYLAVFVPVAALTLVWPSLGIVGVWTALLAWMCARAGCNVWRFRGASWGAFSAPAAAH